jgi:hypothetical protein
MRKLPLVSLAIPIVSFVRTGQHSGEGVQHVGDYRDCGYGAECNIMRTIASCCDCQSQHDTISILSTHISVYTSALYNKGPGGARSRWRILYSQTCVASGGYGVNTAMGAPATCSMGEVLSIKCGHSLSLNSMQPSHVQNVQLDLF